ncbi:MAG: nucleoside triphosphate pyrophosphohydrolase, partial [Gammaproteobacteria bacterium]
AGLKGELGDLLFHVVFYSRLAEEEGHFDLDDVMASVNEKLVRRHPHVFADATVASAEEQTEAWERLKAGERAASGQADRSILNGIGALPGFVKAEKLQRRCARVGFDWPDISGAVEKIEEEAEEVKEVLAAGGDSARLEDELGDLLFACVNLARHARIDPETALRHANRKFERRFRAVEAEFASKGRNLEEASLDEMEGAWNRAKTAARET